ncbi:MAG TPA: hypothetical protein VLS27_17420, partial [Gammaproteobacteria bacterium]|nr:hypothetical protein [Gammaproteobacteria bacterium]
LETNGSEPAQILRPTAVSPVRGHSTDASAEKHSGTRTLRTGNNTRAPITPDAPATTASEEARISSLLDEAREDMDRLRLSTPPGDNALEKYRQVLSLDADNSEAKNGVRKIVETYAQLGRQAARRKDYDRATFFIDQALAIAPDSRPLRRVQRRLKRINHRRQ